MVNSIDKISRPIDSENVPSQPKPKRRRKSGDIVALSKHLKKDRRVAWAGNPKVNQRGDLHELFNDYKENDIWYTREEYQDFLLDRVRTVQCLRASGGDEKALNPEFYCVRGLEPFQTPDVHRELNSKRHFHQSTIIIEQTRQTFMGIRDPDRYRLLVAPQSEMALRRAQELAALDEHDVYNKVCRRGSLFAPIPNSTSSEPVSLSLSQRTRRLQEMNARRLMEIYSQPDNGMFRFPLRRGSLARSNKLLAQNLNMGTRFRIRRDSLTPSSSGHH